VFFICILFDSHSPVEIEQKDDECSNASESSNSTELDTVAPTSLEKARPPVGRRKRTAVSTCSSFNDNSSDDGSRLGNEIQINFKRHPLATNWISLLFLLFSKRFLCSWPRRFRSQESPIFSGRITPSTNVKEIEETGKLPSSLNISVIPYRAYVFFS
jgi:hypothetical protein